ncbi:Immunoglobulin-like domain, partial [Trinorchestia longiramus]
NLGSPTANACHAINVTRVVAPTHLMVGGSGDLECQISLGGDTLYSIKWYQGINEIYRFTPFKSRMQQVFHNDFLTVDVDKSTGGKVHISNVTVGADGPFRCEVSAEAPTFYTDYGVTEVRVV